MSKIREMMDNMNVTLLFPSQVALAIAEAFNLKPLDVLPVFFGK